MVFSKRVQKLQAEGAYVVMERAQALEVQGRDIIHVEIGQPDFPTFTNIARAGMQAIQDGYTRYTPSGGIRELRHTHAGPRNPRRGSRRKGRGR